MKNISMKDYYIEIEIKGKGVICAIFQDGTLYNGPKKVEAPPPRSRIANETKTFRGAYEQLKRIYFLRPARMMNRNSNVGFACHAVFLSKSALMSYGRGYFCIVKIP